MTCLFKVIEPRYTHPGKKTVKANVLDKMQAQLSKEIFNEISEIEDVALTHDSWTSLVNNNYETATVHYISKSWIMKGKVLSTLLVETSHTHTCQHSTIQNQEISPGSLLGPLLFSSNPGHQGSGK